MTHKDWTFLIVVVGGLVVFGGVLSMGFSAITIKIAQAIANEEGVNVPGSRPARNNNPGDLTYDFGFPTTGTDGPFPIFATMEDGWNALYTQVQDIFDRKSHFTPDMSLAQIGMGYAAGDPNWSINIANTLGVTPDTPLNQIT